ncbi:MAG TPA: TonB family protein [Thermoanaerobaculia bacterium]|nr:TonB family protein [Thermoanaerobaculia bacterium]
MNLRAFGAALLLCAPVLPATAAEPVSHERPEVLEALEKGRQRLENWEFSVALFDFQRAARLAGGPCGPCFLGMARAYNGTGERKKAAEAARSAIPLLDRPDALAQAYNELGVTLASDGTENFAEAETAFRKALELGPASPGMVRANLAEVLWRQKKYAESEEMAHQVMSSDPGGLAARNAHIIFCQARADGAPVAPPEVVYEEAACPKDPLRTVEPNLVPMVQRTVAPPKRLFGKAPDYPRGVKQQGTVVVEAIIDEQGCIPNLRVCKSLHPTLDLSTLEAVRRWVFRPAELDGKPVKVYYTLTVHFKR